VSGLADIFTIFEGAKKTAETAQEIKKAGEVRVAEFSSTKEISVTETKPIVNEQVETVDYMFDDIGLNEQTQEFGNPAYIQEIREQNPKVDDVLTRQGELLKSNPSELAYQRAQQTIEQYKGTIVEYQIKDSLIDKFEMAESKQQLVETEWGQTKPDVVMRGASRDMQIGDLQIKKGEDLMIESKCGSAEYIRSQMGHMLQQVEGHDGNSLVVVSRDYLDISPKVRANFEKALAEKGSHLYVGDFSSFEMSAGLRKSMGL
jgi:hypothetical protein